MDVKNIYQMKTANRGILQIFPFTQIILHYARNKNFLKRCLIFIAKAVLELNLSGINRKIQRDKSIEDSVLIAQNTAVSPLFTFANRCLQLSYTVILSLVTELFISLCQPCFRTIVKCLQAFLKPLYMISITPVGTVISSIFFYTLEQFTKHNYLLFKRTI